MDGGSSEIIKRIEAPNCSEPDDLGSTQQAMEYRLLGVTRTLKCALFQRTA
jgi:hypothetical protein